MRKVGLMVGLALVAFACSEQAGQMLVDAGEMMRDAGDADASSGYDGSVGSGGTSGGGGGPAALQPHPVTCDKERRIVRQDFRDAQLYATTTDTTRYAMVEVPDFRTVGVERCDYASGDPWAISECPEPDEGDTVTCTGLLSEPPCSYSQGAGFHVGDSVYVECVRTHRYQRADGSADTTSESGWRSVTLYY